MSTTDIAYERIERTERPVIDEVYDNEWVVTKIEITRFDGLYLVNALTRDGEWRHYAWKVAQ